MRVAVLCALLAANPAAAQAPPADPSRGLAASIHHRLKDNPLGSFYGKLRPRYEFADDDGLDRSHAATLRTVLGFGSRQRYGLSFLVEGEAVLALDDDAYFDGASPPNGRTLVVDPEGVELNQAYLDWAGPLGTAIRLGRQRIVLDDARFIGNVGWRQNEQTYDAAVFSTRFGRSDVRARYLYIDEVRRIFGDEGPPSSRDFASDSHGFHVAWGAGGPVEASLFAYWLDLANAPGESSDSYGVRLIGRHELTADWQLDWAVSYAHQVDGDDAPLDYDTGYAWLSVDLVRAGLGGLALGFERLGSDDGRAGFATPLATAHQFNGYADVFVDNGGDRGLRDYFVQLTPRLPGEFSAELTVHWFETDDRPDGLGWEVDLLLSRPLGRFVTLVAKLAWFDGGSGGVRPDDRLRTWLQLDVEF